MTPCTHRPERQRRTGPDAPMRVRDFRYFGRPYRCDDCGREYVGVVVNRLSVADTDRLAAVKKLRRAAGALLRYAVRAGLVERKRACESCGSAENVTAHHFDYARPFEVEWLCPACHFAADEARRVAEVA